MALVSERRSTLNPDAPLFVPAAFRRVEDFSPEWWQLVNTSAWYRDYWLSQHEDEDGFYDNADQDDIDDVAYQLPDTFDLDAGEEFSNMEAQLFEEFIRSSELDEGKSLIDGTNENGLVLGSEDLLKDMKHLDDRGAKWNQQNMQRSQPSA